MSRVLLAVLFSGSLLGLSACSSLEKRPPPLLQLAEGDIHLNGRLSIQVNNTPNGRPTGGNVGFDLNGRPSAGQLELSTPLGSLLARASWGGGEVRLKTPEIDRSFDDLDALTRELLGEAIPVAALFDWLQGRPWPQMTSSLLEGKNAQGFEQLGWRIDTSRFDAQARQGLIIATRGPYLADPAVVLRARIEP